MKACGFVLFVVTMVVAFVGLGVVAVMGAKDDGR